MRTILVFAMSLCLFGLPGHISWTNAAENLKVVPVAECMPNSKDYTFMWWAHGFNRESLELKTRPVVCIQTGRYAIAIDVNQVKILNLGLIENSKPAEQAVVQDNNVVFSLPKAELELAVYIEGEKYICVGSQPVVETVWGGDRQAQFRIIESGRYVQRADIIGLVLQNKKGEQLNAKARLEITAWPDRIYFLLELTPQENLPDAKLEIKIKQPQLKAVDVKTAEANNVLLCLLANDRATAGAGSTIVSKAIDLAANKSLKTSFDAPRGRFKIELPEIDWDAEKNPRVLDRISMRIENTAAEEKVIPLSFENKISVKGGLPMIRDSQGNPTGICVQISKNWHNRKQRLLYDGKWYHGLTMLRMPAKSATEFEFNLVRGYWGKLPAVAHSQLCLIGWGVNQLWDQVAIGEWGENICYDPDVNLNRSMIDDVRPLMVTSSSGKTKKGWTNNVGGGDFLVYYDENNRKQFLTRMRTFYQWHGPNLSKVTYAGVSADGKIAARITVSSPASDDINRAYHSFRYDVLKPVRFKRLAFYQLGSDGYNNHQFNKMARGNSNGLIEEWTPPKGGLKYHRKSIVCNGTVPWFSLHDGIHNEPGKGAWANRGIVIRSWKAKLGGKNVPTPYASVYGTVDYDIPSCNAELSPPADLEELLPGDFVEAEIELVIVPQKAADYYGPNENLRKALQKNANTWRMIHREAVGNNLTVQAIKGRVIHNYPVVIKIDSEQTAEFEITGGIGYVPVTFTGLDNYKGYELSKITKIDQSTCGNDFRQCDYNSTTKKYSITYNINLDSRDDKPETVRFTFGKK